MLSTQIKTSSSLPGNRENQPGAQGVPQVQAFQHLPNSYGLLLTQPLRLTMKGIQKNKATRKSVAEKIHLKLSQTRNCYSHLLARDRRATQSHPVDFQPDAHSSSTMATSRNFFFTLYPRLSDLKKFNSGRGKRLLVIPAFLRYQQTRITKVTCKRTVVSEP